MINSFSSIISWLAQRFVATMPVRSLFVAPISWCWGWGALLVLILPVSAQSTPSECDVRLEQEVQQYKKVLDVSEKDAQKVRQQLIQCRSELQQPHESCMPTHDCEKDRKKLKSLSKEKDGLAGELEQCKERHTQCAGQLANVNKQLTQTSQQLELEEKSNAASEQSAQEAIHLLQKVLETDLRRRSGNTLCPNANEVAIARVDGGGLSINIRARLPDKSAVSRLREDYGNIASIQASVGDGDQLCPLPLTDEWSILVPPGGRIGAVVEPVGPLRKAYPYPVSAAKCERVGSQLVNLDPIQDWIKASSNHQFGIWYYNDDNFGICSQQEDDTWHTIMWPAPGSTALLIFHRMPQAR